MGKMKERSGRQLGEWSKKTLKIRHISTTIKIGLNSLKDISDSYNQITLTLWALKEEEINVDKMALKKLV